MKPTLATGLTDTVKLTVDRERTIDFMGDAARPFSSASRTVISTGMPSSVAPMWSISTRVPTESSPVSRCGSSRLRQAISMSRTSIGVA